MIEADRTQQKFVIAGDVFYSPQYGSINDLLVAIAGIFKICVKERLVLDNRTADARTRLIAFEAFANRIA